ncbi:MAG: hypothetical protein EXQ79_05975 [Acidimicrobiia bacterium]|nr:hypothetical protein [Acidimicrobiia bacterium]
MTEAPHQLGAYMLSCTERAAVREETLAGLAATDWGTPPVVVLDRGLREPKVNKRIAAAARELLQLAVAGDADVFLVLEDDLEFNRFLRHNLECWKPLVDHVEGEPFFASLYNPNVVPAASPTGTAAYAVADPDKVYGSQAFLISVATGRWVLEHWDAGAHDIMWPRLAAQRSPVLYHQPSLIEHRGVPSTWGGPQHQAVDYSSDWKAAAPSDRHVVIVEDRAELSFGHFSGLCGDLATAFAGFGRKVELLTTRGWVGEGDGRARDSSLAVLRYGRWSARFERRGARWRVPAMIGAARARRRRLRDPSTVMVVTSFAFDPVLAAALCGPGKWLFYQWGHGSGPRSLVGRAIALAARLAEHRRRRHGGSARIVVTSPSLCAGWEAAVPFLRPVAIPFAGCRRRERIPDARARLGIEPDEQVALLFGAYHPAKDVDVVFRTFAGISGWRLLAGGQIGGEVADEATRALLYSAADVVVLSFVADLDRDSGGLMDAIGWGVPVVCSDKSMQADIVRHYRLGAIFAPGDSASLRTALAEVPRKIDPRDLERARHEFSNTAIVIRALGALDALR